MSDNNIENLFAEASSNAENAEAPSVSNEPVAQTQKAEQKTSSNENATSPEQSKHNSAETTSSRDRASVEETPQRSPEKVGGSSSQTKDVSRPSERSDATRDEASSKRAGEGREAASSHDESVMSATGDILSEENSERSLRIGTDEVVLDEDIASAVVLITQEYSRMTDSQREIASGLVSGSPSDFANSKSIGHVVMSFFRVDSLVEPTLDAMITAWGNEPAERVLFILGLNKVLFSSLVSMTEAFGTKIEASEGSREEVKIDTIRQAGRIIGELPSETIEDLKIVKKIISIVPSR